MKRDSLFFRFFQEMPSCFFRLLGRPAGDARRYELNAIEFKETSVRLDGVFQPREPDDCDPAYLWEAQNYASETVYANILSKVGRFLEHGDPGQEWVAVVIYPNRVMEQKKLRPYRCLIESDQLVRIFLDELPPAPPEQFEMGILELIAEQPEAALAKARAMVPRLRSSSRSPEFQRQVVQFVETVILYQFPRMSRKEIEKMLQVSDVRQTRVFQEALEEGLEQGLERGLEQGLEQGLERGVVRGRSEAFTEVALELLGMGHPLAEIAKITGLTPAQIRTIKKKHR